MMRFRDEWLVSPEACRMHRPMSLLLLLLKTSTRLQRRLLGVNNRGTRSRVAGVCAYVASVTHAYIHACMHVICPACM